MSVTLTVRDVPESVRDALAGVARSKGQSLQAYLLNVLSRQAAFSRNATLLDEIDRGLAEGGADRDAPDSAQVLDQARADSSAGEHRAGVRGPSAA